MQYLLVDQSFSEPCGRNISIHGVFTDGSLALQALEALKIHVEICHGYKNAVTLQNGLGYDYGEHTGEICLIEIEENKLLTDDWI